MAPQLTERIFILNIYTTRTHTYTHFGQVLFTYRFFPRSLQLFPKLFDAFNKSMKTYRPNFVWLSYAGTRSLCLNDKHKLKANYGRIPSRGLSPNIRREDRRRVGGRVRNKQTNHLNDASGPYRNFVNKNTHICGVCVEYARMLACVCVQCVVLLCSCEEQKKDCRREIRRR